MAGDPVLFLGQCVLYPYAAQPAPTAPSVGCICPAGANKDCERADCPRKGISAAK